MSSNSSKTNKDSNSAWVVAGMVCLIGCILLCLIAACLFGFPEKRLPITNIIGSGSSFNASLVYHSDKDIDYVDEIVIEEKRAYILGRDRSAIFILDISNPESPLLMSTYQPDDLYVITLGARGDLLYLDTGKLEILDVRDAYKSQKIWEFETNSPLKSITASGDHLYLTDSKATLYIVDIKDQTKPQLANTIQNFNGMDYIEYSIADENLLFVVNKGLFIFDISNPTSPVEIGFYRLPIGINYFEHLVVSKGHVWVRGEYRDIFGESQSQVLFLDISDPSQPTKIAAYDHYPFADLGDILCFYNSPRSLESIHLMDFSNPTQPIELGYLSGTYSSLGYPNALIQQDNSVYAYLTNYGDGLSIIKYSISNP